MAIPEIEPEKINAGDTLKWKRVDLIDYPASQWTLTYSAVSNAVGSSKIEIIAVQDGTSENFLIDKSSTDTAAYVAGKYSYVAHVSKVDERYQVACGSWEILPDIAAKTGPFDDRNHVEKVLAALEEVIEGRALQDYLEYAIEGVLGRRLKSVPIEELLKVYQQYQGMKKNQDDAEKIKKGLPTGNKVFVRFN